MLHAPAWELYTYSKKQILLPLLLDYKPNLKRGEVIYTKGKRDFLYLEDIPMATHQAVL